MKLNMSVRPRFPPWWMKLGNYSKIIHGSGVIRYTVFDVWKWFSEYFFQFSESGKDAGNVISDLLEAGWGAEVCKNKGIIRRWVIKTGEMLIKEPVIFLRWRKSAFELF